MKPSRRIRIAVIRRASNPLSLAVVERALERHWAAQGVNLCDCNENGPLPECDVLWEPGAGWRLTAPVMWQAVAAGVPSVVTIHGLRPFVMPGPEDGPEADQVRSRLRKDWERLREHCWVATPSRFGASEIQSVYGVTPDRLRVISHGVDGSQFRPASQLLQVARRLGLRRDDTMSGAQSAFFLHVAAWQRVKNSERVFEAYASLSAPKPRLLAILPGYGGERGALPTGVDLRTDAVDQQALAGLYRDAIALVAPSLRESFGMPLLEAMACGCPVVTSNGSACAEVTGDAALLVDPLDATAIASAMAQLAHENALRRALRQAGLRRAAQFPWAASAERYAALFRTIVNRT